MEHNWSLWHKLRSYFISLINRHPVDLFYQFFSWQVPFQVKSSDSKPHYFIDLYKTDPTLIFRSILKASRSLQTKTIRVFSVLVYLFIVNKERVWWVLKGFWINFLFTSPRPNSKSQLESWKKVAEDWRKQQWILCRSFLLSGPLDTKFCGGLDIPDTSNTFVQVEIKNSLNGQPFHHFYLSTNSRLMV